MERRPDPRVTVERAEPDPDLVALGPLVPEQARAADRAERLHPPVFGPVDADQLLALHEPEPLARHAALRLAEGAGVLPAARAVAVARPEKRRGHLEANAAAEARPLQRLLWLGGSTTARRSITRLASPADVHVPQPRGASAPPTRAECGGCGCARFPC